MQHSIEKKIQSINGESFSSKIELNSFEIDSVKFILCLNNVIVLMVMIRINWKIFLFWWERKMIDSTTKLKRNKKVRQNTFNLFGHAM